MSYIVVDIPSVKIDIREAVNYYKKINPQLARQFLHRLREARTHISLTPLGFQIKYNTVRTLLLKQFSYHLHYVINDNKQQIIILAVIHSYKNPQDYSARI